MVKKRFVKQRPGIMVAVMSLAVMALAGCSSGKAENPTDSDVQSNDSEIQQEELESGKVELKVWAEESNFETLGKMIESFKQEYAGQADFEIILEASADGEARNNVLGDIHNSADIFSMPDDQLYSLIAGGALSPVANQEQVKNANLAEAVEAASYKGTLYAYPYSADNGYFLYYDKNYFTEEDVKTLDGVLAVAEAAGKKVSMEFNSGWYLYSFFGNTGLEFGINEDGVTNYCNWNSTEGAITGVDVAQALLDITASPAFVAQGDGDFVTGMQEGKVIAGISGVWNAMSVKETWGADYGACKLPTYTCKGQQIQMASFTGYKMFGVNANSEHLAWAHKLADWLTNEENQTLRFAERNQGPSNKNAAASDEVGKVPAIAAVIEQSQYGNLQRVGNSYWTACTKFADIIAAGNPDNVPLQDLMDTLTDGIAASTIQ
ncbi:MAG: extracellular solute-binding protein [Lachnospiraceae bacterium]|nr:extracellular solute-binding protein [Lachnospiraceae bacterium]